MECILRKAESNAIVIMKSKAKRKSNKCHKLYHNYNFCCCYQFRNHMKVYTYRTPYINVGAFRKKLSHGYHITTVKPKF